MHYDYYDCLQVQRSPEMAFFKKQRAGAIACFLGQVFKEKDAKVPVSELRSLIAKFQMEYADNGDQPLGVGEPQGIIDDLCSEDSGLLRRWLPGTDDEPVCELTPTAETVLGIYSSLIHFDKQIGAETTFDAALHHLSHAVKYCDADPEFLLAQLHADMERIQKEIEAIENGSFKHDYDRALSEFRLFNRQIEEVRSEFRYIEQKLRERLNEAILLFTRYDEEKDDKTEILEKLWSIDDMFLKTSEARGFERFFDILVDPVLKSQCETRLRYLLDQDAVRELGLPDDFYDIFNRLAMEARGPQRLIDKLARQLGNFIKSHDLLEDRQLRHIWKSISADLIMISRSVETNDDDFPCLEYNSIKPDLCFPAMYDVCDCENRIRLKDSEAPERPELTLEALLALAKTHEYHVDDPLGDIIQVFNDHETQTMTFAELMRDLRPNNIHAVFVYLDAVYSLGDGCLLESHDINDVFSMTFDNEEYKINFHRIYVTLPEKYREPSHV